MRYGLIHSILQIFMDELDDLATYNGDIEHDMWVDFSTEEYTGELDDLFEDSESDNFEDSDIEDLEDSDIDDLEDYDFDDFDDLEVLED